MVFTRPAKTKRSASTFALAIALATGGVLTATAIEAPAHAQKKKKKDSEEESRKIFEGLCGCLHTCERRLSAEGADLAAVAAMISGVEAAIETPGDRQAAGNLIYNLGQKQSDMAMQLRGVELMVESGLTPTGTPRNVQLPCRTVGLSDGRLHQGTDLPLLEPSMLVIPKMIRKR